MAAKGSNDGRNRKEIRTKKTKQSSSLRASSSLSSSSSTTPSTAKGKIMVKSSSEIAKEISKLLSEGTNSYKIDPRFDASRLDELRRIFTQLCAKNEMVFLNSLQQQQEGEELSSKSSYGNKTSLIKKEDNKRRLFTSNGANAEAVKSKWSAFLHNSHRSFVSQLCERVQVHGRHSSIRCMWGVLAGCPKTKSIVRTRIGGTTNNLLATATATASQSFSSSTVTSYHVINTDLIERWLMAMVNYNDAFTNESISSTRLSGEYSTFANSGDTVGIEFDKAMRHLVEVELLRPYRDVQYYTLSKISKLAKLLHSNIDDEFSKSCDVDRLAGQSDVNIPNNFFFSKVAARRIGARLFEVLMMVPVPLLIEEDKKMSCEKKVETTDNFLFPPPPEAYADDIDGRNTSIDTDDDEASDCDDDGDISHSNSSEEEGDNFAMGTNGADYAAQQKDLSSRNRLRKRKYKAVFDDLFPYRSMKLYRRQYRKAWLSVLLLSLPVASLKRALLFLPSNKVLDCINEPLRFSDFFMRAYSDNSSGDESNIIGVLALEGLFLLITKYGLEYKNYYKQLYKLVTARIMHAKYRVRFFTLLSKSLLYNAMLPAHIVAAFLKRLNRCALSGPIHGSLFVLTLTSNLLKKHPECHCLIQRGGGNKALNPTTNEGIPKSTTIADQFLFDEDDPVKCKALQSSLWELAVLERHYHPAVAALAKSVGTVEEDKAPMYNVETDFVSYTYGVLFDQERRKRRKKNKKNTNVNDSSTLATPLTFKKPTTLFTDGDIFSGLLHIGN